MCRRLGNQRIAVAKTDLEYHRRTAAKYNGVVERYITRLDTVARPQILERALLRRRDASFATHETADRPALVRLGHEK
jgi:hypothetical protein